MKSTNPITKRDLAKVRKVILRVEKVAKRAAKSKRRFALYRYLKAVYRAYSELEDQRLLRALKIFLACKYKISADYDWHSIRRIIEASTSEDLRARAGGPVRWKYAGTEEVTPDQLIWFFGQNGGLSGCARSAAKGLPRYNTEEEEEDDDNSDDSGDDDDNEISPPRWEKEEEDRIRRVDRKYN